MDRKKRIFRAVGMVEVFLGLLLAVFVISDVVKGRGFTVVTPFAILFLAAGPFLLFQSRR